MSVLRARSVWLASVVAVLAALAVGPVQASPPEGRHPHGGPPAGNPHRLVVDGDVVRDGWGRQVVLRGISAIDKWGDHVPDVDAADAERMRSWGLNSVRLGVFWSATMPEQGTIDEAYVAAIGEVVDVLTDAGLYVVLDMHQDLWGHPHGEGAPEWATDTTCPATDVAAVTGAWATNYFSPVVACAFTSFWLDEDLQHLYGAAWQALAAEVGSNPRVVGYDLMNEPFQGLIPPGVFETQYLYPAQARWLAAIREVDPDAIGFVEPPNAKNVHLPTTPPLGLPEGSVYAPHLYGLWDAADELAETRRLARLNLEYSVAEASTTGVPLWVGEWGVRADSPGAAEFVTEVLDWLDGHLAGSAYWEYRPGDGYSPLNADRSERPLVDALVRAYPMAVPGTIEAFHYDAEARILELTWSQGTSGTALIAAPARLYPGGIEVHGADRWSYDSESGTLGVTTGAGHHHIVMSPPG